MKYTIEQTFSTLGHPGTEQTVYRSGALVEAESQRAAIAEMVAEMETPDTDPARGTDTGDIMEIACWREAQEIAGCTYDDDGDRTGPRVYGIDAGKFIAALAVTITDENGEEVEA